MSEERGKPACKDCVHFQLGGVAVGRCRRYPPQVFYEAVGEYPGPESRFPLVEADEWCGEFAGFVEVKV